MPDMDVEQDGALERALRGRAAAAAPPGFTGAVLQRVASEPSYRPLPAPRWLAALNRRCDPVVAGVTIAALGAGMAVDVSGFVVWLESGLASPNPLLVAAAALLASGLWLTLRTEVN